jgi:hypothetical protein
MARVRGSPRYPMRKSLILAVIIAAATSLFAQSLTEKIDVALINVDVTVTSHGAPARGLTRDEFEVLEDGVPQNVTHFYAIENAREKMAAEQPAVAGTPAAARPSPRDERFRRKVLVIIDNRHMSVHNPTSRCAISRSSSMRDLTPETTTSQLP